MRVCGEEQGETEVQPRRFLQGGGAFGVHVQKSGTERAREDEPEYACILLDAIGYELKIVKKEDKEIVKLMKEKSEMSKKRYYMRKHGRKFEICDSETNMRVKGEPLIISYEKAIWRLNELNGTENEGFEPLE